MLEKTQNTGKHAHSKRMQRDAAASLMRELWVSGIFQMRKIDNFKVAKKFSDYPASIREKLLFLRQLILETAAEMSGVGEVEETLKRGEPRYITKTGSTVRIGWKASFPEQYAMYFNCKARLVDTFKELHRDQFHFAGNRAIVFYINEELPINELKQCIAMSLNYHRIKHLPLLGA
jgi:hypothetical protein